MRSIIATYKNPKTNQVVIVYPLDEKKNPYEIFEETVPEGVPFWVILKEDLPNVSLDLLEIDESIPPNGYGKRKEEI